MYIVFYGLPWAGYSIYLLPLWIRRWHLHVYVAPRVCIREGLHEYMPEKKKEKHIFNLRCSFVYEAFYGTSSP